MLKLGGMMGGKGGGDGRCSCVQFLFCVGFIFLLLVGGECVE